MEDNVSTGEKSENSLIIVLQAFEYHKLERFLRRRVSGLKKNMRAWNIEPLCSGHRYHLAGQVSHHFVLDPKHYNSMQGEII
ncbi:MAG: hypothetical protein ABI167_07825 [Nitrosospira sp.]